MTLAQPTLIATGHLPGSVSDHAGQTGKPLENGVPGAGLRQRLDVGIQSMARTVGLRPAGFVAPAWLYNEHLIPVLQRLGIRFTESHFHIFDLQAGEAVPAPVITWATRTGLHRLNALLCTSVRRRIWNGKRLLRIVLHPGDFDHSRIVDAVARTIDVLR